MDCEVLLADDVCKRARKMLAAMIDAGEAAGVRVAVSKAWRRQAPVLMSYGLGHPVRRAWTTAHVKAGGRLVGWDLGYWNRDLPLGFNMRLTIDDDHPHRWIAPAPSQRFDATGIQLREDFNRKGPIVLCGLGKKQRNLKGLQGQQWELAALAAIRAAHPSCRVLYRPKRADAPLPGCAAAGGAIEDVLRGASLVVTAHSNVAVDACIAGVPVQCEDGAAFALYRDNAAPSREQRLDFLRSLAWWQWSPPEAVEAWKFIKTQLSA